MALHVDGIRELTDDAAKAYLRDIGMPLNGKKGDRLSAMQTYFEGQSITSYTPKGRRTGVDKEGTEGGDGSVRGI